MKKSGLINRSANKKVRNATPLEFNGIQFKSKLEVFCYESLQKNKIPAEYEEHKFQILEPFTYNDKKIRGMYFTPDFVGDDFIIECKGFMNDAFPLRWKIFKYYLYKNNLRYTLYLPRNKKDVAAVVEEIVENRNKRIK